jgi:hypothetical protein
MRLAALTTAAALLVVAGACSGDDDDDDNGAEQQPVLEVDENTGPTCLLVDEALPPEVEELPVVPCSRKHSHEIYATVIYDEKDVYPGVEEFEAFAEVECLKQFETFVGISAFDSTLSFSWLVPSLASWNDEEDRDVLCVLADGDRAQLTGTMKNSKR